MFDLLEFETRNIMRRNYIKSVWPTVFGDGTYYDIITRYNLFPERFYQLNSKINSMNLILSIKHELVIIKYYKSIFYVYKNLNSKCHENIYLLIFL